MLKFEDSIILSKLCSKYPDLPPEVVRAIVYAGSRSLRRKVFHCKKSPHRIIELRGFGKFYVATKATHKRGRRAMNKYKRAHQEKVGKPKIAKKRALEIKWLLAKQR